MDGVIRVVKTAAGQPIRAYKMTGGEIGADMDLMEYIQALAEDFGSPLMILTKKQFLDRLVLAAFAVQTKMQQSTSSVAAISTASEG